MQEITIDYGRIKELNLSIKKSLLKSNISNEDILYMRSQVDELISLTCQCDAKSYIFLGKINILEHKYDEAKKCYEKARHLNTKLPSIYYGLFKANVYLENYEEALDNILIFGDLTSASIQIYVYLLQALLDYKNEPIDQPKDLLGQSHLYKPILQNYYLVIQNLNLKQFTKALKHLNICIIIFRIIN